MLRLIYFAHSVFYTYIFSFFFFLFIKQHSTQRGQNISLLWRYIACDKTLNSQSAPGFYLPYPESPPCKPCITLSQHFHFLCLSHTRVQFGKRLSHLHAHKAIHQHFFCTFIMPLYSLSQQCPFGQHSFFRGNRNGSVCR